MFWGVSLLQLCFLIACILEIINIVWEWGRSLTGWEYESCDNQTLRVGTYEQLCLQTCTCKKENLKFSKLFWFPGPILLGGSWGRRLTGRSVQFSSAAQLCLDSLRPHGVQHARLPCLLPTPSLLKLMSIESVMPSNHLILCCPLLLPPSVFPSIRVFSNESALCIRWPKYWSFSFNVSPYNEGGGQGSISMPTEGFLVSSGLKHINSQFKACNHHSIHSSYATVSPFYMLMWELKVGGSLLAPTELRGASSDCLLPKRSPHSFCFAVAVSYCGTWFSVRLSNGQWDKTCPISTLSSHALISLPLANWGSNSWQASPFCSMCGTSYPFQFISATLVLGSVGGELPSDKTSLNPLSSSWCS